MRTTFLMQGREALRNLGLASKLRGKAEVELSSGVRTSKPSDSPVDAAGIVQTRAAIAETNQLQRNLESVQAELRAVDGVLFETATALQRGLTLAAQGASSTQDGRGRELIAAEVEGVLRHVTTLSNSLYGGRYLFGGGLEEEPPFATNASGGVEYRGGADRRTVLFADGRPAAVSPPGDAIFLTRNRLEGAGRTAPVPGAPPATPPAGVGISISGDLEAALTVDLPGPWLAGAPPSGASAGDVVTIRFQSSDGAVDETIELAPLAGGEDAAGLAGALNIAIGENLELAGKLRFVEQGGALQLEVEDTAGASFVFAQSASGSVVTGLEAGGVAGGYSAEEIAAALNAAASAQPPLVQARLRFEARDGKVIADSDFDLSLRILDFDRGTDFRSGLQGEHRVGGKSSSNVFGALEELVAALRADDTEAVARAAAELQVGVDHVSGAQAFYGATLRQLELTLGTLADLDVIHQERLAGFRDADVLQTIASLQQAIAAEQFAIQVAARRQPTILDVLA